MSPKLPATDVLVADTWLTADCAIRSQSTGTSISCEVGSLDLLSWISRPGSLVLDLSTTNFGSRTRAGAGKKLLNPHPPNLRSNRVKILKMLWPVVEPVEFYDFVPFVGLVLFVG
jgi:hypothetical protein